MLNWYTILYLLFAVVSVLLFTVGILCNILSIFCKEVNKTSDLSTHLWVK